MSQGSVGKHVTCGEKYSNRLITNYTSERILKIVQKLPKLWPSMFFWPTV